MLRATMLFTAIMFPMLALASSAQGAAGDWPFVGGDAAATKYSTLAQITPDWRCPELYYMKEGAWVPGPHVPLLWTVANLSTALAHEREHRHRAFGAAGHHREER